MEDVQREFLNGLLEKVRDAKAKRIAQEQMTVEAKQRAQAESERLQRRIAIESMYDDLYRRECEALNIIPEALDVAEKSESETPVIETGPNANSNDDGDEAEALPVDESTRSQSQRIVDIVDELLSDGAVWSLKDILQRVRERLGYEVADTLVRTAMRRSGKFEGVTRGQYRRKTA